MKEKILAIISEVTKIGVDELLKKENEPKLWDSLLHVELVIMLEDEFDIFFEQEEISEMTTVKKIVELIESKSE